MSGTSIATNITASNLFAESVLVEALQHSEVPWQLLVQELRREFGELPEQARDWKCVGGGRECEGISRIWERKLDSTVSACY